jgi:hypothetical protein
MINDNRTQHKGHGSDDDPARIIRQDGETIDAQHYFTTTIGRHAIVCAYEDDRQDGIDHRVPVSNLVDIDTTASTVAEITSDDEGDEIVEGQLETSGGAGQ